MLETRTNFKKILSFTDELLQNQRQKFSGYMSNA